MSKISTSPPWKNLCGRPWTLFDFNVQNTDTNTQLQDELIGMCVDLEAQSLFKRKKPA